jgi:hypothetical protein
VPYDVICDPATGHQIAYADESGKVFDIITNELVALVQSDGTLYSPDGRFLGHLHSSQKAHARMAPAAFMTILKRK